MKKCFKVKNKRLNEFASFEYMDILVKHTYGYIRIVVIYRPPPSKHNRLKIKTFFDDFSPLMEQLATAPGNLLIVGDFNFHLDIYNNPDNNLDICNNPKLHHILESFNLKQHVAVPTHNKGHTLDVIITRSDDDLVEDIMVRDPVLSDHLILRLMSKSLYLAKYIGNSHK